MSKWKYDYDNYVVDEEGISVCFADIDTEMQIINEHNTFCDLLEACQEAYAFCMSIKGSKSRECSLKIAKAISKAKGNA